MTNLITGLIIGLFVGSFIGFLLSGVFGMNSEENKDSKD